MKKSFKCENLELADKLYRSKRLSSSQADNAKCQYNNFFQSVCVIHQKKFSSFDHKCDRADKFFRSVYQSGYKKTCWSMGCTYICISVASWAKWDRAWIYY